MSDYVGEWEEHDAAASAERPPAADAGTTITGALVYASLEPFVVDYLLPMYRRAVSGTDSTWCAEWWRHPEAVVRLEALWRSWEYLRLDPALGISSWLRDHADHHLRVLLSADGPFKGCSPERHARRPLAPLPSAPVPEGLLERPAGPAGEVGEG